MSEHSIEVRTHFFLQMYLHGRIRGVMSKHPGLHDWGCGGRQAEGKIGCFYFHQTVKVSVIDG